MSIGIYKITSPSNKIYIGQSWNIERREYEYNSISVNKQRIIYNSIRKHGFKNHKFELICELPTDIEQRVLDDYEIIYYNQYKDVGFKMLNGRYPGKGGKLTEEVKEKIRKSHTGMKHSKETKTKISIANTNRKFSQETKNKISESQKKRLANKVKI